MPILVLLAAALLGNAEPAPGGGATATATARATIMTPVTLRLGPGNRPALTSIDLASQAHLPRTTLRPCDAGDTARLCAVVVFDLP